MFSGKHFQVTAISDFFEKKLLVSFLILVQDLQRGANLTNSVREHRLTQHILTYFSMKWKNSALAVLSCAVVSTQIHAADWDGSADFGGTYLSGNSDLLSLYGGIEGIRTGDGDELILGLEGVYQESAGNKDSEWVRGYSQYNKEIGGGWYYGLFSELLHDDVADLDYRLTVNPVLGYYVFKTDRASLALEGGPAFVTERQAGNRNSYLALRFAERFEYKFTEDTRFWQSLEYLPEAGDFGNYVLFGEAGIETMISDNWSVKTFVQNRYDNQPEGGLERNDFGWYVALSYNLGKTHDQDAAEIADSATAVLDKAGSNWSWVGTAGASYLTGNTETTLISGALDGMRRWDGKEMGAGVFGGYAEVANAKTAEQYGAYLFYNVDLVDPWYAGIRFDYLSDAFADIDYQIGIGPYLGYRVIDTATTSLKLEVGANYIWEDQGGSDSYIAARFGEYFEHQLTASTKVYQSFEYFAEFGDWDNYNLVNKAGFDTTIFNGISWTNGIVHTYDNTPAPGFKESDLSVVSGLKWEF